MTAEEKQKIYELRSTGLGYKAIARQLGMNLNTVQSTLQRKPTMVEKRYCKQCGELLRGKKRIVFCSKKCKRKWFNNARYHNEKYLVLRVCPECGLSFSSSKYLKRIFCSRRCFLSHESKKWGGEYEQ